MKTNFGFLRIPNASYMHVLQLKIVVNSIRFMQLRTIEKFQPSSEHFRKLILGYSIAGQTTRHKQYAMQLTFIV